MTDNRQLWPLVADDMSHDDLDRLDATLTEWAGVSLYTATMDDLAQAQHSLALFHEAAVKVYASKLTDAGIDAVEAHANGGRR